jgi:neutral ceramidase
MEKRRMNRSILCVIALGCAFLSGAAIAADGPLRVGAAKVDITSEPLAPPATGRYDHEKIYIRAIVLDNGPTRAALITEDYGSLSQAGLKLITEELDCPAENIISSGIHTHSGSLAPIGPNRSGPAAATPTPTPAAPQAPTKTDLNILAVVREARSKLQPALVGFGTGLSYLNVNRDAINPDTHKWTQGANPLGASDKTVAVLMFKTPTGEPIAVYVNYAMHAVNGYVSGVVSADYPGAMCRYVEKAFDDKIIVAFSQGASGDQNPLYLRPSTNVMLSRNGSKITGYNTDHETAEVPLRAPENKAKPADAKLVDNLFRMMESEGQILGEEVIRVMTLTKNMSGNVTIASAAKTMACPGRRRTNGSAWDNSTREGVAGIYEDAPDVNIRMSALRIGSIAIATSTGELYTLIGQRVKQESPLKDTMLVTIINPWRGNGYTPDDASFEHQTFQALGSGVKPGCAETSIAAGIRDLVTQLLK